MTSRTTSYEAAGLVAGFALWSLGFAALYGAHGLTCAADIPWGRPVSRAVLIGIWAIMIAAHLALIAWFFRRLRAAMRATRFIRTASLLLAVAALGTTIWTGVPVVSLSLC